MNENFYQTFSDLFKNTDVNALKEKLPMILSMLNTPEGQELMAKLKSSNPDAINNLLRTYGNHSKNAGKLDDILASASADPATIRKIIGILDNS